MRHPELKKTNELSHYLFCQVVHSIENLWANLVLVCSARSQP